MAAMLSPRPCRLRKSLLARLDHLGVRESRSVSQPETVDSSILLGTFIYSEPWVLTAIQPPGRRDPVSCSLAWGGKCSCAAIVLSKL